jgi:hypothetical protein
MGLPANPYNLLQNTKWPLEVGPPTLASRSQYYCAKHPMPTRSIPVPNTQCQQEVFFFFFETCCFQYQLTKARKLPSEKLVNQPYYGLFTSFSLGSLRAFHPVNHPVNHQSLPVG